MPWKRSQGGDPPPAHPHSTPASLLSHFTQLSLAAALAILVLAGYGIHDVIESEMVQVAESTSIHVGNSIFDQERAVLLDENQNIPRLRIDPADFADFDARMKRYLRSFDMYKIKVFAPDNTIVYSTDSELIGHSEHDNARLRNALDSGRVVSTVNRLEEVVGFDGIIRHNIEILEAYVPISVGEYRVGAFEVYIDTTSTLNRTNTAMKGILIKLTLVLLGVFTLLYLIMRKGMARLSRAERKQRELATRDMLTGLFNRHHLLSHIHSERERMIRASGKASGKVAAGPMALLMIDIDHFKSVNDSHGHLVGDRVLREVAQRLREQLRPYDHIGRYGGEEFLALLPNAGLAESMKVAERLRCAVSETLVACGELQLKVSVSIGAAASQHPDEKVEEIIHRADLAMYQAKRTGRNRVMCVDHGLKGGAVTQAIA